MKKTLLLMIFIYSLVSIAQVRIATPANTLQNQEIIPYDSTSNELSGYLPNAKGSIGQELFLIPNHMYGSNFYKDYKGFVNERVNYSEISGKTFRVIDAFENASEYNGHKDIKRTWIKLSSNEYGDTIYYDLTIGKHTPFLILGYKKYFEQTMKDVKLVYSASSGFDYINEFNTGEQLKILAGSIWQIDEIIISTKSNSIEYLLKNEKCNYISKEELSGFMIKTIYDRYVKEYGKQMCLAALSKEIKVGMSMELVRIAWGSPSETRSTSYGQVWTYKTDSSLRFVYFKKSIVTSWN